MDSTIENSPHRLVEIFFYGLHMDGASLQTKGIVIRRPRLAKIHDCKVIVRTKAILLREKGATAHGMLYQLTHAEIDVLYKNQLDYRAEAFAVDDGERIVSAISMVHINPPLEGAVDPVYATKLRKILEESGLPAIHFTGDIQ
ncbi:MULTISPECIES: hypothetical protein [unclassified Herbaspirillum]|uniref:hypothetical protein n=1 Tax=unclassified Herbaspirillum TaxID=2624150 RepID=UPI000E2E6E20|nr:MULTISPECIES: hypothetical protein [unclassified Herbaspirillum]RFB68615.1 hypothetical protein DZB54_15865 [Herbaspirillum sp. 3R-3a1]TFI05522.1 hypothetical protein E4P32_20540 [Herbaspirillum sp. 3R11]TFI13568.1 hypothetical protein E4P31_18055 [Herbaspirillum sp. 3R-11]TFI25502.1 hypothetical protein E4P30_13385 [Herbaspirillum sp. 3C11]